MLNKIIEFSVKNKLIVALFTIGLIILGVFDLTKLPIDAQPDITSNQVQVITVASSYGATDIERLVTFPIEQATSSISGLTEIRSFSRFGLSLITLVFEDDIDVYWARQQVSEKLNLIKDEIPQGIGTPELGPISTGLGEIFQYVVRPKIGYEHKYDATELRTIQDWVIRRELLGTKGVAEVSSFGGKLKQYEVAIDPKKLHAANLSITQVYQAIENNNQNTGGAYIEKQQTVMFIRSEGLLESIEQIQQIRVGTTQEGLPILVGDIAQVNIGHATRYGAMTYNDTGEVSGAIVMMLKGENANVVIQNIKEKLAVIEKTLPEGVVIEPFLDRAKMVKNTISTVETNLLEGALIVVFILVLFLGNLRAGLLVASVIPLSMLFAVIMMNLFGVGGNLMSLGALDFGLIVDGAIIIVEAVLHQLSGKKIFGSKTSISQQQMDQQVNVSAKKMVNSAVFGQIIILIVYLPILSLVGIEGKMFKPMAQTVVFALIGAFLLSLTYIPMMSAVFLSKKRKEKANWSDRVMHRVEILHQKYLLVALLHKKIILGTVIALFIGAVVVLSKMGGEFIPSLEEGDFAVEMRILPGSSIEQTKVATTQAAKILLENFDEVEKIVTKIGSAEVPTEPMPMDAGDMIIVLKPKSQWSNAQSFDELAAKMSQAVAVIPGLVSGFQFPVQMRFNELMTGARQDVVCKIYGENLDSLALYADRLANIVQRVEGAQDLYVEPLFGAAQLVIDYDRQALNRYDLSIAEVNNIVNMSFAGQRAGVIYQGERKFDLVVRLQEEYKLQLDDINNLLIPTKSGLQVPLDKVANIDMKISPNQIQREDTKRRVVVGFNVRARDVQSIVQELQQKVEQSIDFPTGYSITYGGAFENLNNAKERLGVAVPISLALIFLLLYFAFRSLKHSLLIYTAIPLSAIGGIYFLALRGMPFSISAGVGFIALFGVAVLNGIVLISEFNRLKQQGVNNLIRIVVTGTRTRLRPVLMTAFVASLGFLPMALSKGSGAEVQRPLATVVIGGLMLATFLTLFVLPILYVLFEKVGVKKQNIGSNTVVKIVVPLFLIFTLQAMGQQKITLSQALDQARQTNLSLLHSQKEVAYSEKMIDTYLDLSQTQINLELGHTDGVYVDNGIGISQSFNFPIYYGKNKKLLTHHYQQSLSEQRLTQAKVEKMVKHVFYASLVLQYKKNWLMYSDSLYSEFLQKATLRLESGQSNIIEQATAELQQANIANQVTSLSTELLNLHEQLGVLIQSEHALEASAQSIKVDQVDFLADSSLFLHPLLLVGENAVQVAQADVELINSKLLPQINLGFVSQSLKEINKDRFNYFTVGIGIPIFSSSVRNQSKAAQKRVEITEQNKQIVSSNLALDLQNNIREYQTITKVIDRFEQALLPKSQLLLQAAKDQFDAGEIDFLQWVILSDQAIAVYFQYTDALDKYNRISIELNYLLTN